MRLSNRLLGNAVTTYLRFGATFVLGVFFTWYVIGRLGMAGYGLIALATATFSVAGALDNAVRFGLVRELAAAIESGDPDRVRRSVTAGVVFCARAAVFVAAGCLGLALLAWAGLLRVPDGAADLRLALAVLIAAEGVHACVRLVCAPYTQALFASRHVPVDNLLYVVGRALYVASAVIAFGIVMPEASLARKLMAFAVLRVTLQLGDVALGIVMAKRRVAGLQFRRAALDREELRAIGGTVWHSGQVTVLMDLNPQLVAILINLFFGATYNGIWQIVVQLGGWARLFAQGLLRGVESVATSLEQAGRRQALVDLMMRTIRYQFGTVLPLVVGVSLFLPAIIDLWVGDRLAADPQLAGAGLTAAQAVDLVVRTAYVFLAAEVVRASMFGVQRILYGAGEVRSYSWFAKYAAMLNVGLTALLLWRTGSVAAAPVALLIVHVLYYPIVVLRAASRRTGLPIGRTLLHAVPRPLAGTALLCLALLPLRARVDGLTAPGLLALAAAAGALYALLFVVLVLDPMERGRIMQMLRRRRNEDGPPPPVDAESADMEA